MLNDDFFMLSCTPGMMTLS